jgi:Selenoprotein SelK_SelG
MPYINHDGTVGGRKSIVRTITDFFQGIIDFMALFFSALTNPPQRIESRATYGQRNNGRSYSSGTGRPGGSNIRGVKNLGGAEARMGG